MLNNMNCFIEHFTYFLFPDWDKFLQMHKLWLKLVSKNIDNVSCFKKHVKAIKSATVLFATVAIIL